MRRIALMWLFAAAACARGSSSTTDAAPEPPPPVDAPPDAEQCSMQPCSILPQCGCVGVTACDVDVSDNMGTACRSVLEPGRETSTCIGLDRCDKGYVCLGGSGSASCKKYCTEDADCGSPRGRCAIDINNGGVPITGVPSVCSSNCNPLLETQPPECPSNYKCTLAAVTHDGMQVNIADCRPAGSGTQNASCKVGNNGNDALCARGYLCTTTDGGANFNCRRICNKTTNTGCSSGQTCIGFSTPYTIDIEYGVCI